MMLPITLNSGNGTTSAAIRQPVHPHEAAAYSCLFSMRGSDVWQLSIRPFYQKWILPLRLSDYFLVAIGVVACIAIKRYVCSFQNFYSRPLGILATATSISIIYFILNHRVTQHFERISQGLLLQLRTLVEQTTPADQRGAEFDQLTGILQEDPHFETQGSQLASILERLLVYRRLISLPNADPVAIQQARANVFMT